MDSMINDDPEVDDILVKVWFPSPLVLLLPTRLAFKDGNFTEVLVVVVLFSKSDLFVSNISACILRMRFRLPAPLLPTPLVVEAVDKL